MVKQPVGRVGIPPYFFISPVFVPPTSAARILRLWLVTQLGAASMNLKQLRARVKRLGELSTGLAKEETLWRKEMAFLMHSERALYVNAISRAQRAIGEAR
jgi:hypothetical protein